MSVTTKVSGPNALEMLVRTWEPDGRPRAAVVIVHGLGEHSGRYEHVGRGFADAGFAVTAPDLRGFGSSSGKRAFIDDFSTYLDDLDPVLERAALHGVPVVLLGHSLGGLIALRYAQVRQAPDLLVLSSPAIDAEIPGAKRAAARVLCRILPGLQIPNGLRGDQLSRDPSVGEAYFADPLVLTKTTAALGGAMLKAMGEARTGTVPLPALVIHSEEDSIVPADFSAPLGAFPGVTRVTFPHFRHESFNEEGGTTAIATVVEWIERQLA